MSAVASTASSTSSANILSDAIDSVTQAARPQDTTFLDRSTGTNEEEVIYITKRDGRLEALDGNKVSIIVFPSCPISLPPPPIKNLIKYMSKILQRLKNLAKDLDAIDKSENSKDASTDKINGLNLEALTASILRGMYPNVTTLEIDILAAETAASMATQHMSYSRLAARIIVSQNHKNTLATFSDSVQALNDETGYINPEIVDLVKRRKDEINKEIVNQRDLEMTYFGFKTLERSYLLRTDQGTILERPQYLMMRVALGIHCTNLNGVTKEEEDKRLQAAFETYHLMSQGFFTHASPTLFHSGTTHPQLSSCFLVQMSDDSIAGIYDTLKRCAVISKAAGGIGLSVHNIRARGTPIKGTRGVSNGLIPMLRVYDVTSRYVDQGGGKRPGAFAVYIEPWHADILDVLNLKKNHGKEEQRARDLFYGLWIPDLFMKRVENDEVWSLMCPHQSPGLQKCHGEEFDELYCRYEREGRFVKQMRAREVWSAILESQIETGTPYMLYKDAANVKCNQKNLGTIQCSNLCTEIIQYTDQDEVAVCNLASM